MRLSGWGNYPFIECELACPRSESALANLIASSPGIIGRGLGRSYGDSAVNNQLVLGSGSLRHMISFEQESGLLTAEAGVSLDEILETFVPRGWFPPVTPGTRFVTLGGAVASDVHGKNHHLAGSFSRHVRWLDIWTAARGLVRCSADQDKDLFQATCGGHGLTGFIVRVAVQLIKIPSAHISQTMIKAENLDEIMSVFEENEHLPYSVAWIDCLKSGPDRGRSIFMGGDFAQQHELANRGSNPYRVKNKLRLSVPFNFPSFALNKLTIKAFNALYYSKAPKGLRRNIVDYNTFFYPLDMIERWNRIYGRRGFTQYQFVIPRQSAAEGLPAIFKRIVKTGTGSFLAVLKLFGEQENLPGNISFPQRGYTLALDFPITSDTFQALNEIDALVMEFGGRHYLTKDCRLSAPALRQGYGQRLDEFLEIKNTWDPKGIFRSNQSRRLGLTN